MLIVIIITITAVVFDALIILIFATNVTRITNMIFVRSSSVPLAKPSPSYHHHQHNHHHHGHT
eukprot:4148836-Pyramimonas_sp.AAC.1